MTIPNPIEMQKTMQKFTEIVQLLNEIMPPFEIKPLKIKDKSYIAILFERSPKKEAKP